jgi:hypothetical protein
VAAQTWRTSISDIVVYVCLDVNSWDGEACQADGSLHRNGGNTAQMSERAARREGRRAAARLSFSRLRRRLKPEPTIRSHSCSSARGSKLAGGLDSVQATKAQADKTRQTQQDKATESRPSPYSYSSISTAPSVPRGRRPTSSSLRRRITPRRGAS